MHHESCWKKKLLGLTGYRVGAAVLLGVGVTLSHGDGAGLGLVGAQSLPLLHQTVLVPQVVLHVGLWEVSKTVSFFFRLILFPQNKPLLL